MSKPTTCHDVVILDHGNAKSQHDENQAALQRILLPVFFGDMFVDRLPIQPDHDAGNTIQNTAKRYQNILKHDRLLSGGRLAPQQSSSLLMYKSYFIISNPRQKCKPRYIPEKSQIPPLEFSQAKHTKAKHTKDKQTKVKQTKAKQTKVKQTKAKHTKAKHTKAKQTKMHVPLLQTGFSAIVSIVVRTETDVLSSINSMSSE